MRLTLTEAEKLVWSLLRDRRLAGLKFRRQHPIGPYIADFYCHESRLVVEIDGESHDSRAQHDLERTDYFHRQGVRVFRVSNDDVQFHLEGAGVLLLRFLNMDPQPWLDGQHSKPPHPSPLPRRGGEGTEPRTNSVRPSNAPLFVFGTLRRGEENHRYLDGHYSRMIPAELPGYVRVAPLMIAPQADNSVAGELYFIQPDRYAATMAGCDELEELYPGQLFGREYHRQQVMVTTAEGDIDAWAYVQSANGLGADRVFQSIRKLLTALPCEFRVVHHAPTRTSEESAAARGEPLRIGGKALLLKAEDDTYRLFVLPADARLDSTAIRQHLEIKKTRFASPEELSALTGLVPGSVPPFGQPILPFDLYVDQGIAENDRIAFNAGSLTDSIILATGDYLRAAKPQAVFRFAKRDGDASHPSAGT